MKRVLLVVAAAAALTMIGCNGSQTADSGGDYGPSTTATPEPSGVTQFDDIPVPRDFTLDEGRSYSYQASAFRNCDLFYEGRTGADMVVRFYRDQMPISGWEWQSNFLSAGTTQMKFTKGEETCRIVISRGRGKTVVNVKLPD